MNANLKSSKILQEVKQVVTDYVEYCEKNPKETVLADVKKDADWLYKFNKEDNWSEIINLDYIYDENGEIKEDVDWDSVYDIPDNVLEKMDSINDWNKQRSFSSQRIEKESEDILGEEYRLTEQGIKDLLRRGKKSSYAEDKVIDTIIGNKIHAEDSRKKLLSINNKIDLCFYYEHQYVPLAYTVNNKMMQMTNSFKFSYLTKQLLKINQTEEQKEHVEYILSIFSSFINMPYYGQKLICQGKEYLLQLQEATVTFAYNCECLDRYIKSNCINNAEDEDLIKKYLENNDKNTWIEDSKNLVTQEIYGINKLEELYDTLDFNDKMINKIEDIKNGIKVCEEDKKKKKILQWVGKEQFNLFKSFVEDDFIYSLNLEQLKIFEYMMFLLTSALPELEYPQKENFVSKNFFEKMRLFSRYTLYNEKFLRLHFLPSQIFHKIDKELESKE